MSRFRPTLQIRTPLDDPAQIDYDDVDDYNDHTIDQYWRDQAARVRRQLTETPPTDPGLRDQLTRDLAYYEHQLAAATIHQHWNSGEGDRKLF